MMNYFLGLLVFLFSSIAVAQSDSNEVQLLENPGGQLGTSRWTGATAAPGVETTEVGLGASSISWDAAGADTLTSSAVSMDDYELIKNRLCVMSINYKGGDGNLKLQAWDGSAVIKEVTLAAKANWGPSGQVSFVCPSTGTLALRIEATADAAAIYLDEMFLGTRLPYVGAVVTDWQSCASLGATITDNITGGTEEQQCARRGDTLFFQYNATNSTWDSTSNFTFSLTGLTADASKIPGTTRQSIGSAIAFKSTGSLYESGSVYINESSGDMSIGGDDVAASIWNGSGSIPHDWVNSADLLSFSVSIPIVEWSGTSLVFQPTADDMALTAWKDFSMSVPAIFTNSTVESAKYRRVGDTAEISFSIQGLSGAAVTGTVITPAQYMPPGLTADFGKYGVASYRGSCFGFDDSASSSVDDFSGHVLIVHSNGNLSCQSQQETADVNTDTWSATVPFTFAAADRWRINFKVPVVEWADLGSVPAIGVEVAGDGIVGLAGPANLGGEDGTGETCGIGCDSCAVSGIIWSQVGSVVSYSFSVGMDNTSAGLLAECNFDAFAGIDGANWTTSTDAIAVCQVGDGTSGDNAGGTVRADTTNDDLLIRVSDPDANNFASYFCTGRMVKK